MFATMKKRSGFTLSVIPAEAGIQMQKKKGFTLIELLVVIAIIALLLSILTPALNAVKERAKRVVCGTRLRQYGTAIHSYSSANDGKIMKMVKRFFDSVYFPCYVSTIKNYPANVPDQDVEQPDEWNAHKINPYLELIDKNYDENGMVTPMVACPGGSIDFMQKFIHDNHWDFSSDYIEIGFCYFAGIDEVPRGTTDIEEQQSLQRSENALRYLTMDTLSSKRLLMSDILWIIPEIGEYRYNHGKNGWSWGSFEEGVTGHTDLTPRATGRNRLFGDGAVSWKPIPLNKNLPTGATFSTLTLDDGMWNGPDSGWVTDPWDIAFF